MKGYGSNEVKTRSHTLTPGNCEWEDIDLHNLDKGMR
jgi:hypothetical protein